MLKDCPSGQKKSCCYCSRRESHNRCLCPQKFGRQVTETFIVTTIQVDTTSQTSVLTSSEGIIISAGDNTVDLLILQPILQMLVPIRHC